MNRPYSSNNQDTRRAFTLVELLVIITIIGLLATLTLGVMNSARNTAREARTEMLIAKLDQIIQQKYESYMTRRVPVDTPKGTPPGLVAYTRLYALRDIMRMEMPQNWGEVQDAPLTSVERPAVSQAYLARMNSCTNVSERDTYGPAECLYQIVMHEPGARELFSEESIGDMDDDGLPEFIDGWGNPIYFLRWAPAFNDTDMQPVIVPPSMLTSGSNTSLWDDSNTATFPSGLTVKETKEAATENDPDPFDILQIDSQIGHLTTWRLVPLIVSAGSDGVFDLTFTLEDPGTGKPYRYEGKPCLRSYGMPTDLTDLSLPHNLGTGKNELNHYDNIHNHRARAN